MIGVPFEDNDLTCLGAVTEIVAKKVAEGDPEIDKLAAQFATTQELAAHIRSLPQRDDEGIPDDGPKVEACLPWQRLRFFPPDPNCLERTAFYMLVAERIDPWPVRRMATLDFPWGRHTFPVEEGAPIVLDPRATFEELVQAVPPEEREGTRNSRRMREPSRSRPRVVTTRRLLPAGAGFAGLPPAALPPAAAPPELPPEYAGELPPWGVPADASPWAAPPWAVPPWAMPPWAMPPGAVPPGMPIAIDVLDALNFTNMLAQQGAVSFRNGPNHAYLARNAIQEVVSHGVPPTDRRTLDAIGWFFSMAEKVARSYGARALAIVRTTALAISDLIDDILAERQIGPRNLSFESGGRTFQVPSWLSGVGALAGKIGLGVGALALAPKLAALGITGPMLELVEQELNAEGLSLGPLANPKRSFSSALSSLASKRPE
jgi:hypothetical protein